MAGQCQLILRGLAVLLSVVLQAAPGAPAPLPKQLDRGARALLPGDDVDGAPHAATAAAAGWRRSLRQGQPPRACQHLWRGCTGFSV